MWKSLQTITALFILKREGRRERGRERARERERRGKKPDVQQ